MSLCFMSLESNKIFNQLILNELIKKGFDGLSLSLVVIFPYIDEYPDISISTLAKKLGYSRQAMHKNIKKLEELSYIRLSQTDNKKEKKIKFTDKSNELMRIAKVLISSVDAKVVDIIGEDTLEVYKKNQLIIHNLLLELEANE